MIARITKTVLEASWNSTWEKNNSIFDIFHMRNFVEPTLDPWDETTFYAGISVSYRLFIIDDQLGTGWLFNLLHVIYANWEHWSELLPQVFMAFFV